MSNTSPEGHFEAFWPRSPRRVVKKALARRLGTLAGKRIAFLWDYMFRGDEVFTLFEEALKKRFADVQFVSWQEFGNTHGKHEREVLAALPQRLAEMRVDAVISGMAC